MHIGTQSICPVFCVIASLIAAPAYANGRQPPRSSDITPVKATCAERSGGYRHEIFRAHITAGDDFDTMLNVLIANAREQVAIANVKMLTLPNAQVDSDGFVKAALVRSDDTEERSVMVQIRSGKANLRLVGFRSDGTGISIDLSQCKTIEFSSGARSDGDSNDQPAVPATMKK